MKKISSSSFLLALACLLALAIPSAAFAATAQAVPVLTSVTPSSSAAGTQVKIVGTGFADPAGDIISLGSYGDIDFVTAQNTPNGQIVSDTALIVTIPAQITTACSGNTAPCVATPINPGTYALTIKNSAGASNALSFIISTASATTGTGGNTYTIDGQGNIYDKNGQVVGTVNNSTAAQSAAANGTTPSAYTTDASGNIIDPRTGQIIGARSGSPAQAAQQQQQQQGSIGGIIGQLVQSLGGVLGNLFGGGGGPSGIGGGVGKAGSPGCSNCNPQASNNNNQKQTVTPGLTQQQLALQQAAQAGTLKLANGETVPAGSKVNGDGTVTGPNGEIYAKSGTVTDSDGYTYKTISDYKNDNFILQPSQQTDVNTLNQAKQTLSDYSLGDSSYKLSPDGKNLLVADDVGNIKSVPYTPAVQSYLQSQGAVDNRTPAAVTSPASPGSSQITQTLTSGSGSNQAVSQTAAISVRTPELEKQIVNRDRGVIDGINNVDHVGYTYTVGNGTLSTDNLGPASIIIQDKDGHFVDVINNTKENTANLKALSVSEIEAGNKPIVPGGTKGDAGAPGETGTPGNPDGAIVPGEDGAAPSGYHYNDLGVLEADTNQANNSSGVNGSGSDIFGGGFGSSDSALSYPSLSDSLFWNSSPMPGAGFDTSSSLFSTSGDVFSQPTDYAQEASDYQNSLVYSDPSSVFDPATGGYYNGGNLYVDDNGTPALFDANTNLFVGEGDGTQGISDQSGSAPLFTGSDLSSPAFDTSYYNFGAPQNSLSDYNYQNALNGGSGQVFNWTDGASGRTGITNAFNFDYSAPQTGIDAGSPGSPGYDSFYAGEGDLNSASDLQGQSDPFSNGYYQQDTSGSSQNCYYDEYGSLVCQ